MTFTLNCLLWLFEYFYYILHISIFKESTSDQLPSWLVLRLTESTKGTNTDKCIVIMQCVYVLKFKEIASITCDCLTALHSDTVYMYIYIYIYNYVQH
jgi:hypothetical protein